MIPQRTVRGDMTLGAAAKARDVLRGDNPVPGAKTLERLQPSDQDAEWLETGETVRLLDAARALDADNPSSINSRGRAV